MRAAHPKHTTLGTSARSQLLYLARLPPKPPGGCELLINRTFFLSGMRHPPLFLSAKPGQHTAQLCKHVYSGSAFCCPSSSSAPLAPTCLVLASGPTAAAILHPGIPLCCSSQPQWCIPGSWRQQRHDIRVGHSIRSVAAQLASTLQGEGAAVPLHCQGFLKHLCNISNQTPV